MTLGFLTVGFTGILTLFDMPLNDNRQPCDGDDVPKLPNPSSKMNSFWPRILKRLLIKMASLSCF